jgi:hypothetical protein
MAFEGGTESELAERRAESPTTEQWMEEVCERENCKQALRRVKANIALSNAHFASLGLPELTAHG